MTGNARRIFFKNIKRTVRHEQSIQQFYTLIEDNARQRKSCLQ